MQHRVETLLYAGEWRQQETNKTLAPPQLACVLCGRKTGRGGGVMRTLINTVSQLDMEKAPPRAHHVNFPDAEVKRSSLKQTIYKSTRIRLVSDFSLATRMLEDYGEINPNV